MISSRVVDEDLLKEMDCLVCMEYMVPPIKLCTNGHNICRWRVQCCPTRGAVFSEIRNVTLESIARSQKYPCVNRQSGCLELFSMEHIAKHHAGCVYGKINCPLHLRKNCSWTGLKNDLIEHAKAPKYSREISKSCFPKLSFCLEFVYCFGELFTCCLQKRDGRLLCCSDEWYKH